MSEIITTMLTLCIVTIVGYAARKMGYITEAFSKKASTLVIDICCPCLIMSSVMGETLPDRTLILPLVGVSLVSYIILTGLALLLTRLYVRKKENRGMFSFMIIFGNVAFIGYPVCQSVFGDGAVFYASILNFPNTVWVFTVGVILVAGVSSSDIKKIGKVLLCPGCIAAYVSIIIVAFRITGIPQWISRPMTLIGNITVPASMLIVGASIAGMPLKKMLGSREVYVTSLLRMAVVPVMMFALFTLLPCQPLVRNINTVVLGMPVASYGTMLSLRYGKDVTLMVETTFITTVLSLLTIPLLTLMF